MSHFSVLVISTDGSDNAEQQLAPFQENNMGDCPIEFMEFEEDEDGELDEATGKRGYYSNPNAKWDWYQVGGRYAGSLKVKEGIAHEEPEFSWGWREEDKQAVIDSGKTDKAYMKDIDWEGAMQEGRLRGEEKWQNFANVLGVDERGHIKQPKLSWEDIKRDYKDNLDTGRKVYHEQPEVIAFNKAFPHAFFSNVSDFDCTKEEYGNMCAAHNISTYAVLLDGEWISSGEVGWFGSSTATREEEEDFTIGFFDRFIKDLPDNALLTVVDCHI